MAKHVSGECRHFTTFETDRRKIHIHWNICIMQCALKQNTHFVLGQREARWGLGSPDNPRDPLWGSLQPSYRSYPDPLAGSGRGDAQERKER